MKRALSAFLRGLMALLAAVAGGRMDRPDAAALLGGRWGIELIDAEKEEFADNRGTGRRERRGMADALVGGVPLWSMLDGKRRKA